DLCRSGTVQRCVLTIGALMNKLTLMTRLTLGAAVGALALTSCAGTGDDETAPESTPTQDQAQTDTSSPDAQAHAPDPDAGPPPSGIQEAGLTPKCWTRANPALLGEVRS